MKMSRKNFLRIAAGVVVTASASKVVQAVAEKEPAAQPQAAGSGKRWGMVIDLQKCREHEGCDLCIKACHQIHNVPQIPNKNHEVKWIWNEQTEKVFPFQQGEYQQRNEPRTLPLLCNHCANPACVRVCPTQATFKRGDGVVMMDYHRCIGCRYCMAACPYGSRSFNFEDPRKYLTSITPDFPTRTAGVVEKCNFCEERLADGRLPACLEACPGKAIHFGDLNDEHSPVREVLRARYSVQRQPELGTGPSIFYLV